MKQMREVNKKSFWKRGAATFEFLFMVPLWIILIMFCMVEFEYTQTTLELEENVRVALRIASREDNLISGEEKLYELINKRLAGDNREQKGGIKENVITYYELQGDHYVEVLKDADKWKMGNLIEIECFLPTRFYKPKRTTITWLGEEIGAQRTICTTKVRMIIEPNGNMEP